MEKEKTMEIARAKILRGDVIETLYNLYPVQTSIAALRSMLRYKGLSSDSDIRRAVYYLESKEYVKVEYAENYWDSKLMLQAVGINLAENDFTDVGVTIDE